MRTTSALIRRVTAWLMRRMRAMFHTVEPESDEEYNARQW